MKISWIRYKDDKDSFRMFKNLGLDVLEVEDVDNTDNVIKDLIENDYKTIVLSNEIASFSGDIIKKYGKQDDINIIIAKNKNS